MLFPITNSMFFALNTAYYARWFYMPIVGVEPTQAHGSLGMMCGWVDYSTRTPHEEKKRYERKG